jgi:SAM-dependent methyltransferase
MEAQAYDELRDLEPGHWWCRGMRLITERLLTRHLGRPRDLQILDAGCGAGGNLSALAVFGSVQGLDYAIRVLRYANQAHRGRLAQASVEQLPYRSDSFDLVTSFDVLYCREVGSDQRALAELARVIRPGGHLLIRLPALPILRGPHDAVVHGVRRYTASELRRKVTGAGLVPVRLTYLNSVLMPLIFLIRQAQNVWMRFGAVPHSDVKATARPINALLCNLLRLESFWIGTGHDFRVGVSVLCLAAKPLLSGLSVLSSSLSSSTTRQAQTRYPTHSSEELSI